MSNKAVSVYAEAMRRQQETKVQQSPAPPKVAVEQYEGEREQRVRKKQLVARSASQSVSQSTDQLTVTEVRVSPNPVVDRPKAFYITRRLDRRLDEAVRYFQEKHSIKKVDRSTVVNAILDDDEKWTEEALDLIVDRVIRQLTSRLTG